MPLYKIDPPEEEKNPSPEANQNILEDVEAECEEVLEEMRACCHEKISVGIIRTDDNQVFQGTFWAVEGTSVILKAETHGAHKLLPLSTCMISYSRRGQAHLFISLLRSVREESSGDVGFVSLKPPRQVAVAQVRGSFRIPLQDIPELEVSIQAPGQKPVRVLPCNISLGGMMVDFTDGSEPLSKGSRCKVITRYKNKGMVMDAEIRHKNGSTYGLFFPRVYKGGRFDPPENYRWVVSSLERAWLRIRQDGNATTIAF